MVFFINRKKSVIIIIVVVILLTNYKQLINFPPSNEEKERVILLVDNLSEINDDFRTDLEALCSENNYELVVKNDADVNFFKKFNGTFSLIILRLHSTNQNNITWLFTNEEYQANKYILEQLAGEIHSARVDYSSRVCFVLSSYYIRHYLTEKIKADCVILMGCNGLDRDDMAKAWIDAGALSYVGWKGDVSINKTD